MKREKIENILVDFENGIIEAGDVVEKIVEDKTNIPDILKRLIAADENYKVSDAEVVELLIEMYNK